MFGSLLFMVFCRQCQKKVADCEHHVYPIEARRVKVTDAKVETLAYDEKSRTLEIAFKIGQTWQVFDVPPAVYHALEDSTIASFINFMAQRYRSAPVKSGKNAVQVPAAENCPKCGKAMTVRHRVGSDFEMYVRVLWECVTCTSTEWRHYGQGLHRERKGKWH